LTKNVFITGGSGQDGQILINILKKKKVNVTVISKARKLETSNNVNFIKENLLNKKRLDVLFKKKKPDIILHLAANNPSYSENNYRIFFKDNFKATNNLFNSTFQANQKAKFIFCSSSQIFKKKFGKVDEKSELCLTTDYTKFRIKSDLMMLKYKKKKKINYTNAILFNHDSKYRNQKFLLPRIIDAIIKKDYIFLNNIVKSNIYGDFSHADDICRGLYKIMFSSINLDKIILSSNMSTSINNVIKYVLKKNRLRLNINFNKIKKKKTLIGHNKIAKNKLKWSAKKDIYIAANDIYKFKILNFRDEK
jgi:nucleoside-diphosphate-sugar epimerase